MAKNINFKSVALLTSLWDWKLILRSRQNRSKNKLVGENASTWKLFAQCYGLLIWVEAYLTIIPLALMTSESIAHEAEGRMGYLLRDKTTLFIETKQL